MSALMFSVHLTALASPSSSAWLVIFLISTVAVIFGAYYLTRFIAKKASRMGQGRNIRVLEIVTLARDWRGNSKTVCLIEVRDKMYLVAMTANAIALLDTLEADESAENAPRQAMKFTDAFRATLMSKFGIKSGAGDQPQNTGQDTEITDEQDS